MADIRELIILNPGSLEGKPESGILRLLCDLRMLLRRAVVKSARNRIIARAYLAIYRLHFYVAAELGRRFAGTRAVYLTSGAATGDLNIGVSDIDIAIYGDWPEKRQFKLMKIFGLLTVLSPLFDRRSLASICTVEDLRHLCATDMFMALNHATGARQWKLLYGEPVLQVLPEIAPERLAGCVYMDVRRWWNMMSRLAFGNDVTARDPIFQNTICFKSVAGMLRAESILNGEFDTRSRSVLIEQEFDSSHDPALKLLLHSATKQFLEIASDPREPTLHWFLRRADLFHSRMRGLASFAPSARFERDGTAGERWIAPETMEAAQRLVHLARMNWPEVRAAYLVPSVAMSSPDSLALLLEPTGALPSLFQLQQLTTEHLRTGDLPQRLALYLLLPEAAYQLDSAGALDFFHFTLAPQTAPDVFLALTQPEFLLHGEPRSQSGLVCWSLMARELMLEELAARRGAYARFGVCSRPLPAQNLRNFLRYLQLLVMESGVGVGKVYLPTTLAAVKRSVVARDLVTEADWTEMEAVHTGLPGGSGSVNELVQRVYQRIQPGRRRGLL